MKIKKPITHALFLADIERFCAHYGFSEREIGLRALNDTSLFGRIRDGKSPRLSRVEQVYDFMISYAARASDGD